jgi:histidinol dehydrogenase
MSDEVARLADEEGLPAHADAARARASRAKETRA